MNVSLETTAYSPDELLTLGKEGLFDLIDGRLVERHMGAVASIVARRVGGPMGALADRQGLGFVFGADCGYKIWPERPRFVRYPDVSFVRRGRLPDDRVPGGHIEVSPDLVVEVVSPNDEAEEIEARVTDYLRAGAALAWVVYPISRSVYVIHSDGGARRLTESDELSGEDVLPGFACRVGDLFAGL